MMDMPCRVKATHTINCDGSYTIFLNSRLNVDQQYDSYMHEIEHIINDDLHSNYNATCIEYLRHEEV